MDRSPPNQGSLLPSSGFSILFHQYGHGLTALSFVKNPEIHLVPFGGFTSYRLAGSTEKESFLITLNGPVFTALLAGISYYLLESLAFSNYHLLFSLYYLMKINLFLPPST